MAWQTPITDRTYRDIVAARTQLSAWMEAIAAGEAVVTTALRGALNAEDLNRIEGNVAFLRDLLTSIGYTVHAETRSWDTGNLPRQQDFTRIFAGILQLLDTVCPGAEAPLFTLPDGMENFGDLNRVEEAIGTLRHLVDNMQSCFLPCGAFAAGDDRTIQQITEVTA